MRIGIMQPYLFPYKGYFDLIASVDKFVILDDVQYITRGWINRNYFPMLFTFRLTKHSGRAKINECYFYDINDDKERFMRVTKLNANKYLEPLRQEINLARNISYTLRMICDDLDIPTPFYYSSDFPHGKFVEGLLDIVKALGGDTYVNLPGGRSLYNQEQFGNITLEFIDTVPGNSILCSKKIIIS